MDKVLRVVLSMIALFLILFSLWAVDVKICDKKLYNLYKEIDVGSQSGYELENFSESVKYKYLSNEYQAHISEEEYEEIKTVYEAKELFDSIPVEVNITRYNDYRYIDTDNFKTPLGDSYGDRNELIQYYIVFGMEKVWKPVIKRMHIIIEKF